MRTVNEIYDYLKSIAPLELQLSFDNSGFQLGRLESPVTRVLLALDVTDDVVAEAEALGAQLIVAHHPMIFTPLKQITDEKLFRLIKNDISVISMHTNLDIAEGGVNDVLISLLGASCDAPFDEDGCGRVGTLPECEEFSSFLLRCRMALKSNGLRYYDSGRPVHKLAVMGGAGGDYVQLAYDKGCDTYVTADVKYHQFLEAQSLGINLIDGDHFCTETPVIPVIAERLSAQFDDVEFIVSGVHKQVIQFI